LLERQNAQLAIAVKRTSLIQRRTLVVLIFPEGAGCLRLIRAVAAERHEEWMEGSGYLNADS